MNEMLSFHFSRFCLSQSQGSRREREFCPLNLEVRDENEIFLSISQGSRRDRDIFFQVSCFEMGLRDEINQILTRIFEIENYRYALLWFFTGVVSMRQINRMTQIENITRNGKTSLSFVGVPSTASEKMLCSIIYDDFRIS